MTATTESAWLGMRQRFSILFVITLALSVASLLEHIKFALDAWHAFVTFASHVSGVGDALRGFAALVAWSVEWWRSVIRPPFRCFLSSM